jgi:hypothetical protein
MEINLQLLINILIFMCYSYIIFLKKLIYLFNNIDYNIISYGAQLN